MKNEKCKIRGVAYEHNIIVPVAALTLYQNYDATR